MNTIEVRNAHQGLPYGVQLLEMYGRAEKSRNGPVLHAPTAVTTTYHKPLERIVFWPIRDYNPAFVLYEALWMLQGRRDVKPLLRYVRDFAKYSDDGETLHGAYGYRWRQHFLGASADMRDADQLSVIAHRLGINPRDRRSVLTMFDPIIDLQDGDECHDIPCNIAATFQRGTDGRLNLTVFCRSNDILWGTYYANAFHFSMLLEYMAHWIGCEVGIYEQVSVNYHAYYATLDPMKKILLEAASAGPAKQDPYEKNAVRPIAMKLDGDMDRIDKLIEKLLVDADSGFSLGAPDVELEPWTHSVYCVLKAHHFWRTLAEPERFDCALDILESAPDQSVDWIASMKQWIASRRQKWETKLART